MTEDNILSLMINHHALLEVLFALFKAEARSKSEKAGSALSELIWETKKHFFAEESAIFDFVKMENYGVLETTNILKKQHIIMIDSLNKFSDNLEAITDDEIESFHRLMEAHREIEEKRLYPKLDKELKNEQKLQIVGRIDEIPINQN